MLTSKTDWAAPERLCNLWTSERISKFPVAVDCFLACCCTAVAYCSLVYLITSSAGKTIRRRISGRSGNNKLERKWKEAIVPQFEVLPWHLSGGTEQTHEQPQPRQPVTEPRFKSGICNIRSRNATHWTRPFCFDLFLDLPTHCSVKWDVQVKVNPTLCWLSTTPWRRMEEWRYRDTYVYYNVTPYFGF